MLDAGAANLVIESSAQMGAYQVILDLGLPASLYSDMSLAAESIQINAQTTTDAPAGSRIQPGYPVRNATLVLSGLADHRDASKTIAWLLGQYPRPASDGTVSPLYRKRRLFIPVTVNVGIHVLGQSTPVWIPQFTGRVDSITVNGAQVTLVCVDDRSALKTGNLPALYDVVDGKDALTSEFVLDAVLRSATGGAVGSWPPQRPTILIAAGMRTAPWSEAGYAGAFSVGLVGATVPGRWGTAFAPVINDGVSAAAILYTYDSPQKNGVYGTVLPSQSTISTEFVTGHYDANSKLTVMPLTDSQAGPRIDIQASQMVVGLVAPGTGTLDSVTVALPAITRTDGTRYVYAQFTWASGGNTWSAKVYVDGITYTVGPRSPGAAWNRSTTANLNVGLILWQYAPGGFSPGLEAFQVTSESVWPPTAGFNDNYVPTAVIDPSLNPLTTVPPLDGDAWQIVQELCSAEGAVAGFDETGLFFFKNRNTLTASTSVRTLTSKKSIAELPIQESAGALFNHVKMDYSPWTFGAVAYVWTINSVISVPPNQTKTIITSPDDVDGLFTTVTGLGPTFGNNCLESPPGATLQAGFVYYRASTSAAGTTIHPGVLIQAVQLTPNTMRIDIKNPTNKTAWLVSSNGPSGSPYTDLPPGTPFLKVGGFPIVRGSTLYTEAQWPPLNVDGTGGAASDPNIGDQLFTPETNQYRQDSTAALTYCQSLLSGGAFSRPSLAGMSIHPDPRLQITDRCRVVDDDVTFMDEYVRLWGKNLSLSNKRWSMTVQATAVTKPGGWILGLSGRSRLGVSTHI